jgi:predicted  nucleic acid-binding Zn-ribbon protein
MARYVLPVAAGLLVAALGLNGFQWYRGGERLSSATGRVSQLREEISRLNRQISDRSQAGLSAVPAIPEIPEKPEPETDRLVLELAQAQGERRMALAELQSQSQKLVETQADTDALNRALEEARNSEVRLSEKLAKVERALQTRTSDLESLRKQGSTHEVTLAIQEKQIGELVRKVNEQVETIQRDRELLAADRDIRDLMTDRNLRVLYVEDSDPSGERIVDAHVFYAEGRRLIVYAHETPMGEKSLENFSLQAWGKRSSALTGLPKSLGIFYSDARNDKGWILKFDDAEVLSQIDSVFVTLEPKEGSLKPGSRELLYSYLTPDDDLP